MPATVRLHRILRAPPARVYRAFVEPSAVAKWNPPHGFTAEIHEMDVRVGGRSRISFINFSTGTRHSFRGEYLELIPNERIRCTDRFDDPNLEGEMITTISLKAVSCGTELEIVQESLPDPIPPEACYIGWQESLNLLAQLVEADIPDGP